MKEEDLQEITEEVVKDIGLVFNDLNGKPYIIDTKDGLYKVQSKLAMRALVRKSLEKLGYEWSGRLINAIIGQADLFTDIISDFDENPNYIMLTNGCFNLNEGKFSKKFPRDARYTSGLNFPYRSKKDVTPTRFLQYMDEISVGDTELKDTLLEILGALLASDSNAKQLILMLGSGANSKSCFMNLCKNLVPSANLTSLSISAINSRRDFDRHWLSTSRLNVVNELENSQTLESLFDASVKALVTGDEICGEIKGGDKYTFRPSCTVMVATNHLPGISKSMPSYSVLRRYLVLPFLAKFTPEQQDPLLEEKLKRELPGIFHYALDGWKRLKRNNYVYTYQKKSDDYVRREIRKDFPYVYFVDECICKKDGNKLYNKDRYQVFKEWAKKYNVKVSEHTEQTVSKKITEAIIAKWPELNRNTKSGGDRYKLGIDIVDEWKK